jgi:hypothetical protein
MLNKSNLLVISFFFPPYNGVSGRRWAKFVKYMYKSGVRPYVLAGSLGNQNAFWLKDTELYKDNIFRIKDGRPYYKRTLPENLFQKLIWKSSMLFRNYMDPEQKRLPHGVFKGYEKLFLEKAVEIISSKNISHVIISVPPGSYLSIIVELKRMFPPLNIGVDYRDKLEDFFSALSPEEQQSTIGTQLEALKHINYLLAVNNEMLGYYSQKFNNKLSYLLPHCVDLDDVPKNISSPSIKKKNMSFLYGGELYNDLSSNISLFISFIKSLESKQLNTSTEVYTWNVNKYKSQLESGKINCNIHPPISNESYFQRIIESDYLLLFRPDWSASAPSSKFFEMVAMRKPILYFGKEGYLSELITKHRLGFHFTEENFDKTLKDFLFNINTQSIPDASYDISKHTFEYQTALFLDFLKDKQRF